ncbi:MAG: cytochrome c maturation protein CcmE [Ignavibacteria bacterium]|nr:cytochrome c maturation protein CcmE [Ignavibacteria bacterium]
MKVRYLIGIGAVAILFVIGYFALVSSTVQYADLDRAERLGKTVQVVGTWVSEKGSSYDAQSNTFRFVLQDEKGRRIPVELNGAKPNNFEIAVSVVVKGQVDNGVLKASNILTKCPSKYEAQAKDPATI